MIILSQEKGLRVVLNLLMVVIIASIGSCATAPEIRPSPLDISFIQSAQKERSRKICIFMDGTDNSPDAQTNVRRLFELVSAKRDPEFPCYYDVGVGAAELPLSGMAFGAGLSKNVMQAYGFICENYRGSQDKIYIFGYSRGARQAQILCDLIDECGIPREEPDRAIFKVSKAGFTSASRSFFREFKDWIRLRRYGEDGNESLPPMRLSYGWPAAEIEFAGIFDNVESMASNVWQGFLGGRLYSGEYNGHGNYAYDLPANVKEAYHAMAMDEKRGLYEVIKWTHPQKLKKGQVLQQVWFAGGHGDVGGGYNESQSLSAIPLNWMISKLEKHSLIKRGYRVYADLKGPVSNTRDFWISKPLAMLRRDRPRYEAFWSDRIDNGEHPGSITRSISVRAKMKPLVHESVYRRLALKNLYRTGSGGELERYGYRPWLLHQPEGFKVSYVQEHVPGFSYYVGKPSEESGRVDLVRFRAATQSVYTDKRQSEAGGFQN